MAKQKKYPLLWLTIVSLVVLVVSVVVVAVCGVKTSIEIGGGSQIEVCLTYEESSDVNVDKLSDADNTTNFVSKIKKVLANHNASIDSYFLQDNLTDTYLIVRIAKTDIKGADTISAEISEALNISADRVSDVQTLKSYFSSSILLYIGLGILCAIVILFFVGWLRYGLMAGISLPFAFLYNIIISLAVLFAIRVQFSMISLIACLVLSILSTYAFAFVLERVRENRKSSAYADYTAEEHFMLAYFKNKSVIFIAVVLAVACIALIFVPINYVRLAAVSSLIALLVSAYTYMLMAPALHCYLLEISSLAPKKNKAAKQPKKAKENLSSTYGDASGADE